MKRRAFLGFLGGAAVAGPQVAKSAADLALADLQVPMMGLGVPTSSVSSAGGDYSQVTWAKEALKRLTGRSAMEIAKRRREFRPYVLDPDTAALRSISLGAKLRRTSHVQFERQEREQKENLHGIIAGWWE